MPNEARQMAGPVVYTRKILPRTFRERSHQDPILMVIQYDIS
jgi:hypothetical protein